MEFKSALRLVLAVGLLPFCSVTAMAAELQVPAEAIQFTESGLLLAALALVLGFTVVARRTHHSANSQANSADAAASEPAHKPSRATVHKLVVPGTSEPTTEHGSMTRTGS